MDREECDHIKFGGPLSPPRIYHPHLACKMRLDKQINSKVKNDLSYQQYFEHRHLRACSTLCSVTRHDLQTTPAALPHTGNTMTSLIFREDPRSYTGRGGH